MAREFSLVDNIKNVLEDIGNDDIIQLVINNVSLENFEGVVKPRRNKRKILEFLQKHFNLAKHAYAKGQKNYWIIRGFSIEDAEKNSKQYSECYSRSPENIARKYNCSIEEAQKIFHERNGRAQQSRDNLPEEEKARINKLRRNDKQSLINRYGEKEGLRRYEERIAKFKQSISLESLIERYGEEEGQKIYNERNAARSSSLESLIKKYGEEEGTARYQQQVSKKAHAQTLQGYIDRYGFDEGCVRFKQRQQKFLDAWAKKTPEELARIRNLQVQSLEKMIERYGEENGRQRYYNWMQTRRFRASAESLKVFVPLYTWLLDNGYNDDDIFFGYESKKEFFICNNDEFYSYDFCIKSLQLIFEFNGILYHPKSADQENWHMPYSDMTAKQKFEYDQHKLQFAKNRGYKTIVLWEDVDYMSNLEYAIDVIKALKEMNVEKN